MKQLHKQLFRSTPEQLAITAYWNEMSMTDNGSNVICDRGPVKRGLSM
jgi:hypothetical protein